MPPVIFLPESISAAAFSDRRTMATTWSENKYRLIATDARAIAINASNMLFAGTYGI
jgi:hypothetical protein